MIWTSEHTLALLALAALGLVGAGLFLAPRWLRFCALVRYSLLVAGVLVVLPPLAVWGPPGVQRLLRNLFALAPGGLLVVTLLATLAVWVAMTTADLTRRYAAARFAVEAPPAPHRLWRRLVHARLFTSGFLALPMVLCTVWVSWPAWPTCSRWWAPAAVAAGWLLALLLVLLAVAVHMEWLSRDHSYPDHTLILPARTPWRRELVAMGAVLALFVVLLVRLVRVLEQGLSALFAPRKVSRSAAVGEPCRSGLWAGYRDTEGSILPGHLTAASFLFATGGLYMLGGSLLGPDVALFPSFPALGYVLWILILVGWALPAVAFFFDRYRVPTLLLAVTVSFVLHVGVGLFSPQGDHYWRLDRLDAVPTAVPTATTPTSSAPSPSPAAATVTEGAAVLCPQPARQVPPRRPVVYVAASGGGISAAVWTARVLAGLQCAVGEELPRSLEVVSAVSGGSVGTLHYLDRFDDGAPPSPGDLDRLVAASAASSLGGVAWGLAYPDLWRTLVGVPIFRARSDRGWAMEQEWKRHLDGPTDRLSEWRREVAAGRLPGAVFNATVAETGRPFRFSTVELPPGLGGDDFATTFPRGDVEMVTAARLSATFPWVSPLARPRQAGGGDVSFPYHLGDGGYYDNFGVATLVDWLRIELDAEGGGAAGLDKRGVLLVEIRASAEEEDAGRPLGGWSAATVGPVATLMNVRSSGQRLRNDLEMGELVKRLCASGVEVTRAHFDLTVPAPLSWKLTAQETAAIVDGWDTPGNRRNLAAVRCAFGLGDATACAGRFDLGGCRPELEPEPPPTPLDGASARPNPHP